ncbi:GntR family transcriptional regulator [Staphylococcus sp. 17KM0847]|nr:GntR family transcriptional regulator [Staphylococcus sp. 17KM0847]
MGQFPGGQALPTEKALCERFEVSRMTLRQAIKLLAEDGIVTSVRGKGHFVVSQNREHHASSIGQIAHPLQQMSHSAMSLSSLTYRVDLESEYTNHLFPTHPTAVVAMERYYTSETNHTRHADAFCFSFIPISVIDAYHVNTQDEQAIHVFVEEIVYSHASHSDLKLSITQSPAFKNQTYTFDGGDNCWLVVESLYGQQESPIMINKWYLPQQHADVIVSRVRDML